MNYKYELINLDEENETNNENRLKLTEKDQWFISKVMCSKKKH